MQPAQSEIGRWWLRVGAEIGDSASPSCVSGSGNPSRAIGDYKPPDRDCSRRRLLRAVRSANASCLKGCNLRTHGNRPVTPISPQAHPSSTAISGSLTSDLIDETAKALVMKKPAKRCWSDLPLDLLEKVFKRLPPLEQFRFRIVCRAWYRATAAVRRNSSPWLVIFHHCNFNGKPRACGLQHLFVLDAYGGSRFYDFSIPEDFEGWRCSGSSQGWLFLWSGKQSALLNPLTASSVVLPNLLGCSLKNVHKVILSSSPTFSSVYIVAMLFASTDRKQHIAFWKPGEKDWLWEESKVINADIQDILFSCTKKSLFFLLDEGLWFRFTPCFSDKAIILDSNISEDLDVFYLYRKRLKVMTKGEFFDAFGFYDTSDEDEVLVSRRDIIHQGRLDTMNGNMKIGSPGNSTLPHVVFLGNGFSESLAAHLCNQSDERGDFIYTVERSRKRDCFRWGIYSMRTRSFLHTSFDITLPKKRKCCSGSKITTPKKKKKYYLGSNPSIEVAWFIPSFS